MRLIKGSILYSKTRQAWIVYYSYLARPFQDNEVEEDVFSSWRLAMNAYRERDRTNRERLALRVRNRIRFADMVRGY